MPIDFTKLNQVTEEERQEISRQFEDSVRAKIALRVQSIDRLSDKPLNDWERKFLVSMQRLATVYCQSGFLGGKLMSISEKQVEIFVKLCEKYSVDIIPN